ncbi:hypothetical protein TWF132_004094 [Orbilia oligospora]|nr:hypothetical protein TWF132_004094 [Orbilia oligospora]
MLKNPRFSTLTLSSLKFMLPAGLIPRRRKGHHFVWLLAILGPYRHSLPLLDPHSVKLLSYPDSIIFFCFLNYFIFHTACVYSMMALSFVPLDDAANWATLPRNPSSMHNRKNSISSQGPQQANMVPIDVQNCLQSQSSNQFPSSLPEADSTQDMDWLDDSVVLSTMHAETAGDAYHQILNQYLDDGYLEQYTGGPALWEDSQLAVEGPDGVFAGPSGPDSSRPTQDAHRHQFDAQDQGSAPATDLPRPISAQDPNLPDPTPNDSFENPPEKPIATKKRRKPTEQACRDISGTNCDKVFSNERNLGDHLLKKHDIKAFGCPNNGCDYRTSRKDNLNAHKKKCKCGPRTVSSTSTKTQVWRRWFSTKRPQPKTILSGLGMREEMIAQQPDFVHSALQNIHQMSQAPDMPMPYPTTPSPTGTVPPLPPHTGEASLINNAPFISMGNGNSIAINTQAASSNSQPEPQVDPKSPSRDSLERENARLKTEVSRLKEEVNRLARKVEKLKTVCKYLVAAEART